jgi:type I restriction enzyme, S subunit
MKSKPGHKLIKTIFQEYEEIPNDWDFVKLSDTGQIIGGGTPETKKEEFWKNGDISWFIPKELTKLRSNFVNESERKITNEGLKDSSAKLLPKGSILITTRATIGNCAICEDKVCTNQGFQNLFCKKGFDNKFLMYSIRFNKKRFRQYSQGTTFLEISKKNISNIEIPYPQNPLEAEKIGMVLLNLDALIEKQKQAIEENTKLMKGQEQRLFRGNRDTNLQKIHVIPKYIDFRIPKEWDVKTLDELSVEIRDGPMGYALHRYDYVEKGIPLIQTRNLKDLKVNKKKMIFISDEKHSELKKSQLKPQDIIISKTGILGAVGVITEDYGPANLNQALARIELKDKKLVEYVSRFLISKIPQFILGVIGSSRTVQAGLKLSDIKNLKIPIPSDNGHEMIARTLYNLDLIIIQQKKYEENLQRLKMGLLQQLLTGKKRVKV